MITNGSLFTGYGGLEIAASTVLDDLTTIWTCDNDPTAAQIIAHRYPHAPNLGDITAVDWTTVPPVDMITAGWPCQPFSQAGKRQGLNDERALWPEVARAIRLLRPSLVYLENVPTILALGEFGRVAADMAALGYMGKWVCVRAADIGAPHGRDRIFIVATHPGRLCRNPRRTNRRKSIRDHEESRQPFRNTPRRDRVDLMPTPTVQDGENTAGPSQYDRNSVPLNTLATLLDQFGKYAPAISRWATIMGRDAPNPTIDGRLAPRFVEWLMGLPDGWVTDTPGISRSRQLKTLGNGVVPQQAAAALDALTRPPR